jgi:hypothetical protein
LIYKIAIFVLYTIIIVFSSVKDDILVKFKKWSSVTAEVKPDLFADLGLLRTLNLGGNSLSDLHDRSFYGLVMLEDINLQHNNIRELNAKVLLFFNRIYIYIFIYVQMFIIKYLINKNSRYR